MKNADGDNVVDLIENLYLLIKHTASGFVAVGLYMFLNHLKIADLGKEPLYIILLALGIGIFIYAIHFAIPDKLFYRFCVGKCFAKYEKPLTKTGEDLTSITFSTPNKESKKQVLFLLYSQTYLRHISEKQKDRQIQKLLDKRLAFLNFLYCSSYSAIILAVGFAAISLRDQWDCDTFRASLIRTIIVFALGVAILICALVFNRRICMREIWAITNFPQKIKEPDPDDSSITATSLTSLLDQLITKIGDMKEVIKQLKKDV